MAILGSVRCTALFREVLVFPIDQLTVMDRGKGVLLQRYKAGELSDVCVFELASGLLADLPRRAHGHRFRPLAGQTRSNRPHGTARLSEEQPLRGLSLRLTALSGGLEGMGCSASCLAS